MRWLERWFGVLAGALGLIALAFSLMEHVTQVSEAGPVIYGQNYSTTSALLVYVPLGLAVVAALLVCFAAVLDSSVAQPRGMWTWLVALAALLCVAAVVALALNGVWVEIGAPPEASWQISAAVIFAPATLAAIISMFTALRPRVARA